MKFTITLFSILFIASTSIYGQQEPEPPRGMSELEAYSIYYDAYRSDDYQLALEYGEWMIEAKPREIEGYDGFSLENQFSRMITVYAEVAEMESDPSIKEEYLVEAQGVFNDVYETFSESDIDYFEWKMKEGRFYQENRSNLDISMEEIIKTYTTAYEMDVERFVNEGDGYFAQVLLTQLAENGDKDKAFELIDTVEPLASAELQTFVDEIRQSLFENPEERIAFIEERIESAEPQEKEQMYSDLVSLYKETGEEEKLAETALSLYELNNNFENTKAVADTYMSSGEYQQATQFLTEAETMATSDEDKKEVLLNLSEAYLRTDQFEQARNSAQKVIQMDRESGQAYMKMASIYAGSISNCVDGGTLDREDRTVYWLVLDYLEDARQVAPSMANGISNQLATYEEAMPSTEDKFFKDWEVGQSFEIDGQLKECYSWVNETTEVR